HVTGSSDVCSSDLGAHPRAPGLPADLQGADRPAAGPDPGDRADGLGQVDHAGGDARPHQQERVRPHPLGRGPDRIRAHLAEMPGQPARGAPRYHGFGEALRSALREDPDYILVGEMRDLETIRLALTAAETGHLVFGTL